MKTNKIIRELKNADRHIFKALNGSYGFNFENPFDIYEVETPFTLGKVEKRINPRYTLNKYGDTVVILICYDEGQGYRHGRIYGVEAVGTGASDFNVEQHRNGVYPSKLDHFYAKYEFNDVRKLNGKSEHNPFKVFVICQHNTDLGKRYPTEKVFDFSERLTVEDIGYYRNRSYTFDKSGYRVDGKQSELKHNARALREKRAKEIYKATDNTETINRLKKRIEIAREIIITRLQVATTSKELDKIADSLDIWRDGLGDALRDFERLTERDKEKGFDSVETFNKEVCGIDRSLDNVITGKIFE